jgi:hypothetical protein
MVGSCHYLRTCEDGKFFSRLAPATCEKLWERGCLSCLTMVTCLLYRLNVLESTSQDLQVVELPHLSKQTCGLILTTISWSQPTYLPRLQLLSTPSLNLNSHTTGD